MMSPDNHNRSPAAKPATGNKDETQGSTPRKAGSARPPEPALKCPRCDSPNTKFCYYNNYSLTQPRHFCKTCRRYWTKGGALRNVPIGGGCRKSKKMKSSPRLSGGSKDSTGSGDHIGGLKFFQGISPAMDFNLGGINFNNPSRVPTQSTGLFNQLSSYGDMSQAISSNPTFDPSSLGASSPFAGFNFAHQEMGSSPSSLNVHSNLASSIESLSSINQDLHWKLQQQRLAMLFVGDNQKENISNASLSTNIEPLVQKPQPILFQNLDVSKPDQSCGNIGTSRKDCGVGSLATEWYFDNGGYATHHVQAPTPATSSSNVNDQNNSSNWSGFQTWGDLNQYTALP